MGSKYTISAVKQSTTLLTAIQNSRLNIGMEQLANAGSGAVEPTHISIAKIEPRLTFDTLAIKTALAGLGGKNGVAMSNLTFWLQKLISGGARGGVLTHTKVVAASGSLIPVQIGASIHQAAIIGYEATPVSSDGVASPLAYTPSQSLEANQNQVGEVYTLGPVSINGTELEDIEAWTLNFGLKLLINYKTGAIYPDFSGTISGNPYFTLSTSDLDKFASWGLSGVIQTATDSTFKLDNQILGGARGTSPITFSLDEGLYNFEDISGNQGGKYIGTVKCTPVGDGTNDIIAITGLT